MSSCLPAALLSVSVNRFLTTQRLKKRGRWFNRHVSAAEAARQLNAWFAGVESTGRFLTMVYGVLDIRRRRFRHVTAGHLGPIHLPRKGTPTILETVGVPIGVQGGFAYVDRDLNLRSGDRVYLLSDGVVETQNAKGAIFSEDKIIKVLDAHRNGSLDESITALVEAARARNGRPKFVDDVSVLGLEVQ